jgi:hypothetical protein
MANAQGETVATKSAFRARRCFAECRGIADAVSAPGGLPAMRS